MRERPRRSRASAAPFPGWAGIWVHDLVTGTTSGWNSDAQFPAASTVKLGVLLAALRRGVDARRAYDLRAMTTLVVEPRGEQAARAGGRAALGRRPLSVGSARGAARYPQGYRVGTSSAGALDVEKPPPSVSGRVTTAHDLGRILYVLHAGALGNCPGAPQVGARPCAVGVRALAAARLARRSGTMSASFAPGCVPGRRSLRRTAGSTTRATPRRSSTRRPGRASSSS